MTTVILDTRRESHEVLVMRPGREKVVLTFDLVAGLEGQQDSTPAGERSRARRTAEGLRDLYGAELIVV